MKATQSTKDIEDYINNFPKPVKALLEELRGIIQNAAPEAIEIISYGIPTFKLHGNLVHFAAAKNHIGFYPSPSAIRKFASELETYTTSKGAIQFPLNKSIPASLINKIVLFRVKENTMKMLAKGTKKVCIKGHTFIKSSACPVCPKCEAENKPGTGFLSELSAPARRALESKKISTLKELSQYTEAQLMELHGFGKASLPIIHRVLKEKNLKLKN